MYIYDKYLKLLRIFNKLKQLIDKKNIIRRLLR